MVEVEEARVADVPAAGGQVVREPPHGRVDMAVSMIFAMRGSGRRRWA